MSTSSRPRRGATFIFSIVTVAALAGGSIAIYRSTVHRPPSTCRVDANGATYMLEPDQAMNATTITAVGKRIGLPDHAVTVALAAAFQESKLHNLAHGDRDSLGLFQQRPSQGWGTASQVQDPVYAATAFFTHLAQIRGWENLPVTTAAQAVQHSSAPDAYANWESEARAVARATTGEVPAAFTCRNAVPSPAQVNSALQSTMSTELGAPDLGRVVPAARGWTVATWLVAHARQFGVTAVTFDGRRWTPSSARWSTSGPRQSEVEIEQIAS